MKLDNWSCRHCGYTIFKTTEKIFKNKTRHLEIKCDSCNSFSCYAPSVPPEDWIFHFGMYKGKTTKEIFEIDPGYLQWIRMNMKGRAQRVANEFLNDIDRSGE